MIVDHILVNDDKKVAMVVSMAKTCWEQHYTPIIGKQQVDYMLSKFQSFSAVKGDIEAGVNYYMVLLDNDPAGYFSIQFRQDGSTFLSKCYVLHNYQGRGVGKSIIQKVMEITKEKHKSVIALQVNKNNLNSIAFYEKCGFNKIKGLTVDIGEDFVMDDYWMERTVV